MCLISRETLFTHGPRRCMRACPPAADPPSCCPPCPALLPAPPVVTGPSGLLLLGRLLLATVGWGACWASGRLWLRYCLVSRSMSARWRYMSSTSSPALLHSHRLCSAAANRVNLSSSSTTCSSPSLSPNSVKCSGWVRPCRGALAAVSQSMSYSSSCLQQQLLPLVQSTQPRNDKRHACRRVIWVCASILVTSSPITFAWGSSRVCRLGSPANTGSSSET
ncbi:hypothetical protein V8C86DRAFT_1074430 [Haematococcus lacustris]